MTKHCKVCNTPIPAERLEALPHTETCVQHSTERAKLGFMISAFSKGTASEIVMVPDDPEQQRRARRANARRR